MLTHSHDFELFIPICEEVKKIYRDHSHHPKIPSYYIVIPIYITQHFRSLFIAFEFVQVGLLANFGLPDRLPDCGFGRETCFDSHTSGV